MNPSLVFFKQIFDIYGTGFSLRYHYRETYQTICGAIFGMVSILTILMIILLYFKSLFSHSEFKVLHSNEYSSLPLINLSNVPVFFALCDKYNNPIEDDASLYHFVFQMKNYEYKIESNKDRKLILTHTEIKFEPCNRTKHLKGYENLLPEFPFEKYKCIAPNQNISLFNRIGDTTNGFRIMNLYLNKCSSTSELNCYSDEEIKENLTETYINFIYGIKIVDHYSLNDPIKPSFRGEFFHITPSYLKRYYYRLVEAHYNSDNGILFTDIKKDVFFEYHSSNPDIEQLPEKTVMGNIGYISLSCASFLSTYNRTYTKTSSVLGSIGGFANVIIIVGKLIVHYTTRRFLFADIINDIIFEKNIKKKSSQGSVHKSPSNKHLNFHSPFHKEIYPLRNNFQSDVTACPKFKLKIKYQGGGTKGNNPSKEKPIEIKLSILQALLPSKFLYKNSSMKLFFHYDKVVKKYLSLDFILPIIEKSDLLNKKMISEGNSFIFQDHELILNSDYIKPNNLAIESFVSYDKMMHPPIKKPSFGLS